MSMDVIAILGQFKHSRRDNEQTITLAKHLAGDGKLYEKSVYYNMFINLPSFILFFIPVWLLIKHNDGFTDVEHCDAIVVSGRKMIRYARHIKKTAITKSKIIQSGDPRYAVKPDVVLKPEHGRLFCFCKNVIRYRGHFCDKIDKETLQEDAEHFANIKNALKGPFIGVFIGEKKYSFKMSQQYIEDFAKTINKISHNMNMPLLIHTRENTPKNLAQIMKDNLDCSYYFYDYRANPDNNPKVAFMEFADIYVLFSGSIVKQCEIIAQGKPTFIFQNGSTSKKYTNFLNSLIDDKCVKIFDKTTESLENFEPKPLHNFADICEKIEKVVFDENNN